LIPIIICYLHSTTKINLESTKKLIFAPNSFVTSLKQTYYLKFLILSFDFNLKLWELIIAQANLLIIETINSKVFITAVIIKKAGNYYLTKKMIKSVKTYLFLILIIFRLSIHLIIELNLILILIIIHIWNLQT
jgi:hypothetical protein